MAVSYGEKHSQVLTAVTGGSNFRRAFNRGKNKFTYENILLHIRFCSNPASGGVSYAFNINPNTLKADYEIYTCGRIENFYVIPMSIIEGIYCSHNSYKDRTHPQMRILNMNTRNHRLVYGQGGEAVDCSSYFRLKLARDPEKQSDIAS